MRPNFVSGLAAAVLIAVTIGSTHGQTVYDWVPAAESDWNVNANWVGLTLNFVPDADSIPGESARINNGGTAVVAETVPRVSGLNVANGAVDIRAGGVLGVIDDGINPGNTTIGSAGIFRFSGNGSLMVASDITNAGTLELSGPDAVVQIGGDFSNTGTLVANITDAANHSAIEVMGDATLGGRLQVGFGGISPDFGQSWDLVEASSISGAFGAIDVQGSAPLPRGLQYQVVRADGTASLAVNNALILTVDRQTGAAAIGNVIGEPISLTGYAIRSDRGLLAVNDWQSASDSGAAGPGWREANPTVNNLAELNLTNSFNMAVGESLDLGQPYNGGASMPFEEDVRFEYTTLDGRLVQGIVEYSGAVNDFTLFVDPENGEAAIGNLSRFIETPVITGYAVLSDSASLIADNWTSFADSGAAGSGWREANPTSEHLAELNLTGSMSFTNGTLLSLGEIFATGGMRDLVLQYSTPGGELLLGSVQYGPIPVPTPGGVPGDYNGNGTVEQADLDLVLLNWGTALAQPWVDGTVDQAELDGVLLNWGSSGASGLATNAVPEPSTLWLAAVLSVSVAWRRKRRGRPVAR